MPRVNLLIADDVGLGKTIEAGLVCQELIIRHRARKILIICPAALQIQWRDQMRDKFGLEFRIVDTERLRSLRVPEECFPALERCRTYDDLVAAAVPDAVRNRLFDVLAAPDLDRVLQQPSYVTGDVSDLLQFVEGRASAAYYIEHPVQPILNALVLPHRLGQRAGLRWQAG